MGMNFSPMYQPVSTKTIKADGDLNVNPYDLLATDVKCDTVEADEFVGGVGNFSSLVVASNLYPKYNITSEVLPNPRYTFAGSSFSNTVNQSTGTVTWYNNKIYASALSSSTFALSNLELIDSIPITIYSNTTNARSRYVALYVDDEEVLRTTSQGTKTYYLTNEDLYKTIKIDCYLDKNTYTAGINSASIGSAYIY